MLPSPSHDAKGLTAGAGGENSVSTPAWVICLFDGQPVDENVDGVSNESPARWRGRGPGSVGFTEL